MVVSHTGFAEVNGARLYCEVAGAGQSLVFVHAGWPTAACGMANVEFFARHYLVIRYDIAALVKAHPWQVNTRTKMTWRP